MKVHQIFLTYVLILIVSLNGCKSKDDNDTEVDSNSTEPNIVTKVSITDETLPKDIIVTVNGVDITEVNLAERIQTEIEKTGAPVPERFLEQYRREIRRKTLDDMIVELLLDKEVEENQIVVTEEDVDDRIRQINAKNRMSMKDFLEMLQAMGKNLAEYKQYLRKRLSHEKLLRAKLFGSLEIGEEEARKYYSENPDKFQEVGQTDFEQVKDDIMQQLYKNKQKELFDEHIEKLKRQAHIVYLGQDK